MSQLHPPENLEVKKLDDDKESSSVTTRLELWSFYLYYIVRLHSVIVYASWILTSVFI